MSRAAFTLVELLLVVMILAVLAGLSAPLFSRNYELRGIRQAADDVVDLMRYARVRAMSEQVVFRMVLGEHEAVLLRASGAMAENGRPVFTALDGVMGRPRVFAHGVVVQEAPETVSFYPDGTIDRVRFRVRGGPAGFVIATDEVIGQVSIGGDTDAGP